MNEFIFDNMETRRKAKLRFITNLEGFFATHRFAITFLIVAAFLDAFSTFCFMYVLGVEYELHPLVRSVSEYLGPFAGPFIGGALKIGLGLCAIIYVRKFAKTLLFMAGIFYCYAFMHNLTDTGLFDIL